MRLRDGLRGRFYMGAARGDNSSKGWERALFGHIITNNQFELNQAVLLLNRFSSDKFMRIGDVAALVTQATDTTFQALFLHNQQVAKLQGAVQLVKLSLV